MRKRFGLKTEFIEATGDGQGEVLEHDLRTILFRNVRELLTNVVKHAQAKKVSVHLERTEQRVKIGVRDDGVGFNPAEASGIVERERGFGLFSIMVRMADLGGSLDIVSAPGEGCTATLTAPLDHRKKAVKTGRR